MRSSHLGLPKLRHRAKDLTPQRVRVLRALFCFERDYEYPPSVRELAQSLRLRSPSTVYSHLESLHRQGLVLRLSRSTRNWSLTRRGREFASSATVA